MLLLFLKTANKNRLNASFWIQTSQNDGSSLSQVIIFFQELLYNNDVFKLLLLPL